MSGKNIFDVWGNPDWGRPIDLSWPLRFDGFNPRAFHIPSPSRTPLRSGSFVGSVAEGGSCNVFSLSLHPHGQGTHTECVGHISVEPYCINDCLRRFWFRAFFCRIEPRQIKGDRVITRDLLKHIWENQAASLYVGGGVGTRELGVEAIIVCALDWTVGKNSAVFPDFSGSNPPYFEATALDFIREMGVSHLLTDLPSVDREDDGGLRRTLYLFRSTQQGIMRSKAVPLGLLSPKDTQKMLGVLSEIKKSNDHLNRS